MAGDWIKMRSNLATSPKVVRIASALKADRLRVIGGLHAVWCLFDAHSDDGTLVGYSPVVLDDLIGWPGFSAAMIAVEWMLEEGENLVVPRFDDHNGASAKRRAQDADRKKNVRNMSAPASASEADKKRTREEKRREEEKNPPTPPADAEGQKSGRRKREKITFSAFLDQCQAAGESAIPKNDPIFTFANDTGIPKDYLHLAWREFSARHRADGRMQKDWRAHFRDAVRRNWFKLWWFPDTGSCDLTTAGVQLARERDAERVREQAEVE